ncbi:MAG: glycosyltransferase family 39 protein [Chloroherpetonaceae bacterium]|nr:glycosyltransferase family 39 protein [Chloroherpetonaceae bacterium]
MSRRLQISFGIAIFAAVFFIPFLGAVHLFDWDEINFAESAREMIVTQNYTRVQVDFHPFWEKPPLFFWLQVISMKIFGVNEFGARFPNALCGIITLVTLFNIGAKVFSERFGLFWALAYMGSMTPHFYFKTGIIDPYFNLFIFTSLLFLISASEVQKKKLLHFVWAGVFAGLAVLTKGPVGLAMIVLVALVYSVISYYRRETIPFSFFETVIFGVTALLVSSIWYGLELLHNGTQFFNEFIAYQLRLFFQSEAGHEQPFYYHFVVLLFGVFPSSFLAIASHKMAGNNSENEARFFKWMHIFLWVPFVAVSLATTKIVHYSSLCYFSITFLAAYYLYKIDQGVAMWKPNATLALAFFGGLVALLLTLFPVVLYDTEKIIPLFKDKLTKAALTTPVLWSGWEWAVGALYGGAILLTVLLIRNEKIVNGLLVLFGATMITIHLFTLVLAPKIEEFTQAGPIRFYQSKANEDVYVLSAFKSYAPYFYTQKKLPKNVNAYSEEWLLKGSIDKPLFVVAKVTQNDFLAEHPDLKVLHREGGFIYLLREPILTPNDSIQP